MIRACAAPYNFRCGASVNRPTSCMKLEILWSWAAFGTTQPKAKSKRKRNVNYGGNGRKKAAGSARLGVEPGAHVERPQGDSVKTECVVSVSQVGRTSHKVQLYVAWQEDILGTQLTAGHQIKEVLS